MGREDWYRRKSWSAQDREDFLARLKRSRGAYNKAQYTRIQAVELFSTKNAELVRPALDLLDMLISEWPEETSQIASAYQHRAECLLALNRIEEAVNDFRMAFEWQRKMPGWKTDAHLDFAWMVATRRLTDLFDESLAVLDEFGGHEIFPIQKYRSAAACALIADQRGDSEKAAGFARIALEEAKKTHTGFRYHPSLCLVGTPPDEQTHEQIKVLARDVQPSGLMSFIRSFRR
jgi:tetratricopeptide (TPR) repeat protein